MSAFQDVAGLIGQEAATRLMAVHGGKDQLKVPSRFVPHNRQVSFLMGIIGEEATRTLIREYGGDRLYVPSGARKRMNDRDREIIARYDGGAGVNDLARSFGLSARRVRGILVKPITP